MLKPTLLLVSTIGLAACSWEVPDFLGREGGNSDSYAIAPQDWPDPVPIPLTSARIEPALRGVIVEVVGLAPTSGYHTARLTSSSPSPVENLNQDRPSSGVIELEFHAIPPAQPEAAGPTSGRILRAAAFLPARFLEDATAVRIDAGQTSRSLSLN